jgi:hypothetical protein
MNPPRRVAKHVRVAGTVVAIQGLALILWSAYEGFAAVQMYMQGENQGDGISDWNGIIMGGVAVGALVAGGLVLGLGLVVRKGESEPRVLALCFEGVAGLIAILAHPVIARSVSIESYQGVWTTSYPSPWQTVIRFAVWGAVLVSVLLAVITLCMPNRPAPQAAETQNLSR